MNRQGSDRLGTSLFGLTRLRLAWAVRVRWRVALLGLLATGIAGCSSFPSSPSARGQHVPRIGCRDTGALLRRRAFCGATRSGRDLGPFRLATNRTPSGDVATPLPHGKRSRTAYRNRPRRDAHRPGATVTHCAKPRNARRTASWFCPSAVDDLARRALGLAPGRYQSPRRRAGCARVDTRARLDLAVV